MPLLQSEDNIVGYFENQPVGALAAKPFTGALLNWANAVLPKLTHAYIGKVVLKMVRELEAENPKLTGRSSKNWQVSTTGSANDEEVKDWQSNDPVRNARDVLKSQNFLYVDPRDIIIFNNVPYINRLNNGWSKQAPAGWVDRVVTRARVLKIL